MTSKFIFAVSGVATTTMQAQTARRNTADRSDRLLSQREGELRQLQTENTDLRARQSRQTAQIADLAASNRILQSLNQSQLETMAQLRSQNNTRIVLNNHSTRLIRSTLSDIQSRTAKTAAVNVGSVFGEAVPVFGIGIIVAATTFELAAACETMIDLHALQLAIDPDSDVDTSHEQVCGLNVPTKEELWAAVKSAPEKAWDTSMTVINSTSDWASEIETPDFSGAWSWLVSHFR